MVLYSQTEVIIDFEYEPYLSMLPYARGSYMISIFVFSTHLLCSRTHWNMQLICIWNGNLISRRLHLFVSWGSIKLRAGEILSNYRLAPKPREGNGINVISVDI